MRYETKLTFLTSHQSEIDVFITAIEITSLWPEIFLAVVMLFKNHLFITPGFLPSMLNANQSILRTYTLHWQALQVVSR